MFIALSLMAPHLLLPLRIRAKTSTPIAESEQFCAALKMRWVQLAMARIMGASHSFASRPGNLLAKVAAVWGWIYGHR